MLEFLTQSTWAYRIGWVLVHSLWQFALVALLAIVLQRALRRRSATTRYRALLAVMAVLVAVPVATWLSPWSAAAPAVAVKFHPAEKPESVFASQQVSPSERADDAMSMASLPAESSAEVAAESQTEAPRLQPASMGVASSWLLVQRHIQPWLPEIVLVWFAGVLVAALRPLLSWRTVRRLRTAGVSPVTGAVQGVLDRTAKRLKFARAVEVLQSTLVKMPVVVGYFRPAVLLPLCVVAGLPEAQLELILAHELAHIRRHDYLINLLQTVIETLFFYHPAVWWLSRQIRNERENCCDDVAMAAVGSRADYGRALLAIEELRAASTALSLAACGGSLLTRIRRIAGCEPLPRAIGGGSILCVILLSIAIVAAVTWGAAPTAEKPDPPAAPPVSGGLAAETRSLAEEEPRPWGSANVSVFADGKCFGEFADEGIRKEMKLTTAQEQKLQEILAAVRPQYEEMRQEATKLSQAILNGENWSQDSGAKLTEHVQELQKKQGESARQIAQLLTAEQWAAFKRVRLELAAAVLAINPQYANLLGLSDEQKKQLYEVSARLQIKTLRSRNANERETLAVLSPQQQEQALARFPRVASFPEFSRGLADDSFSLAAYPHLDREEFRTELSVTDEQLSRLEAILQKHIALARKADPTLDRILKESDELAATSAETKEKETYAAAKGAGEITPPEATRVRPSKDELEKMKQKTKDVVYAMRREFETVLTPQQVAAARKTWRDEMLLVLLRDPASVNALGVSDEQQKELRRLQMEWDKIVWSLLSPIVNRQAGEEVLRILGPERREKLQAAVDRAVDAFKEGVYEELDAPVTEYGRLDAPTDEKPAVGAETHDTAKPAGAWQPGQVLDFRVINAKTKEPLPDVKLKIGYWAEGDHPLDEVKFQTTNAEGRSEIRLPDRKPELLQIYPAKTGFVPLLLHWRSEPAPPAIPKTMTVSLEPGIACGGIVQNEEGKPIVDVTVNVRYQYSDNPEGSPYQAIFIKERATTDKNGRWQVNTMPAQVVPDTLLIYLTHPEYVSDYPQDYYWPTPVTERPSYKALREQTAVMVLRKGTTIAGRVTDESGKLISGALICNQYACYDPNPFKITAITDNEGHFRLAGLSHRHNYRDYFFTVQAAGYAPVLVEVSDADARAPAEIKLERGHAVQGQVVDENGKPLEGVSIKLDYWMGRPRQFYLKTTTDAEGKFRIDDAPEGRTEYDFEKKDYIAVRQPLPPSSKDYQIALRPPISISGSILDAQTNKPLAKCTLTKGWDPDDRAPEWETQLGLPAKKITDGRYEIKLTQERWIRIRVEADGYMPAVSRLFKPYDPDRGRVTYDFKLTKAAPMTGTVLGLDGKPLADAEVFLAKQQFNVKDHKASPKLPRGSRMVKTDAKGRFEFPPEAEPFYLIALHDQGHVVLDEKQFALTPTFRIGPWSQGQSILIQRKQINYSGNAPAGETQTLTVRIVDPQGKPVEGANVATSALFRAAYNYLGDNESAWDYFRNVVSDHDGRARIADQHQIDCVVARHVERKLVAIQGISPQQAQGTDILTLTLQPQCKVFGKLTAKELQAHNRKITHSYVGLYLDSGRGRPLECFSNKADFHFYLPPGTYTLHADAEDTQTVQKTITVKPGQQELEVEPIDLPPTGLVFKEIDAIAPSPRAAVGQAVPDKVAPESASRDGTIRQSPPDDSDNPASQLKTISGVVVDEDQKPVADAQVWQALQSFYSDRDLATAQARSDKDGRFGPFTLKAPRQSGPLPRPVFWIVWAYAPGHSLSTVVGDPSVKIVLRPPTDTALLVLAPDGKPLAGAVVEPCVFVGARQTSDRSVMYLSGQYWVVPNELRQAVRGTTGADGRVSLPGVPRDGLCSVQVTSQAYGTWVQHLDASQPRSAETAIRLQPAGCVEGQVIADDPQAARGITISLAAWKANHWPGPTESYGRADVITDDEGRFVVPAIAKGSLTVRAQIDEHSPYQPELPQELMAQKATTTRVEVRLVRPVRIETVVRSKETGEPLANAYVSIHSEGNARSQQLTSDKQGKITAYVVPGTVTLNAAVPLPNGGQEMSSWREKTFTVPAGVERFELPPLEVIVGKPSRSDLSPREEDLLRKSLSNYLMDWGVRQDLKLTDEQLLKYGEIRKRSIRSRDSDPRERQQRTEDFNKALEDLLTPAQIARLKQIGVQSSGVNKLISALKAPNTVAAALQLSDEQQQKLWAIGERSGEAQSKVNKQLQAILKDRSLSSAESKTKSTPLAEELERLRNQESAEALAILTPEQRKKFDKMQGPKFAGFIPSPPPAAIKRSPEARLDNWCLWLMEYKSVQKDLQLTADQQAKAQELKAKAEVAHDLMSYVGAYEREKFRAELEKRAEDILSPEQAARINGIYVQILGADALSDPAVVEALQITEQQKEKLKTIKAKFMENNKWRSMDEAIIAEALGVLTPQQREQFEKLKGARFDMSGLRAEDAQRRKDKAP